MLVIRIVVFLGLILIGVSLVMYLYTRNRRWLRFSWQVFKFGAVLVGAVVLLLVAERLLLPVI